MTMNRDSFLEISEKLESMPNILNGYIPKENDIKRMEENPEKYMLFMNYYVNASHDNFDEKTKNEMDEAERKINKIIEENMKLYD